MVTENGMERKEVGRGESMRGLSVGQTMGRKVSARRDEQEKAMSKPAPFGEANPKGMRHPVRRLFGI
jgi:hypothetical protein